MKKLAALLAIFLTAIDILADAHVLVYHRFDEPRHASTHISTQKLREHFEYFKKNGYEVVPASRLVAAINGAEPVGERWVVLAVDDGYRSFYEKALPIFKEYNYPFVLFVYVQASDEKYGDYMSFAQIKEAEKHGEIGLHAYAHPHLLRLDDAGVRNDFSRGVEVFKKHMGYAPKYYAYPYGEYDGRVLKIAKEFKFDAIFNQNTGAVASDSPLDDIDRTPVSELTPLGYALYGGFLKASWQVLPDFPRTPYITGVRIKTDSKADKAKLFVSGQGGFRAVSLENGELNYKFKKPISRYATRIILQIGDKTTTKILTKDNHAK